MIPELIAASALALPPTFSGRLPELPDKHDVSILRMLSSFYQQGPYDDLHNTTNKGRETSRMLVVSDQWDFSGPLRRVGLQAWQLSRWVGIEKWFIQGELTASPIRDHAFHIVWAIEPIRTINYIFPLMRMVRDWGFLIVDLPREPKVVLDEHLFKRVPFEWQHYGIWRRMGLERIPPEPQRLMKESQDDNRRVLSVFTQMYLKGPKSDLPRPALDEALDGRILIMSDGRDLARNLRDIGLHVIQMTRWSGLSRYTVQGVLEFNPIKHNTMHIAWSIEPIRTLTDLMELGWTVRYNGFLILNVEGAGWGHLPFLGFKKLNFEMPPYQIWRKSA